MRCAPLALVAVWLALAPAAHALTLQDLNAGTAFASSDGTLTFSFDPGSVVLNGSLPGNLLDYLVTPIVGGFQVSGPMAAVNGTLGGLALSYQVTAGAGLVIDGASLLITGVAFGASALGTAGETLSNGSGLGVLVTGFGGGVPVAGTSFSAAASLGVVTGVQLLALGLGEVASIQTLRESFAVVAVPELSTGMLLGAGLVGLALFGNTPRRVLAQTPRPLRRRG